MKIIFLCGSLEQGRDGVGDYTRRLAGAFVIAGNEVYVISLNDAFVTQTELGKQQIGLVAIPTLRCSSLDQWEKRINLAREWVKEINPDWLSLQYVPYSFNKKGLPFNIARKLHQIGAGKPWHIMFHELWIGFSSISPFKHRIVGFFQKQIASLIVRSLKPGSVSTSNALYQQLLKENNIDAFILPLFSNIEIAESDNHFYQLVLERLGIGEMNLTEWKIIGIFGTVYPGAGLEAMITSQVELAKQENKRIAIIHFGKNNPEGAGELSRLENLFLSKVKFLQLGEQPEANISRLLQLINAGISCTPPQHIGKSGVFAAMRYHGVDVLLPKGDVIPEYNEIIKSYLEKLAARRPEEWGVKAVSGKFIDLLKQ